jgi:hypothetical protein
LIVVDTSAWIEMFRDTTHPVGRTLDRLIERREDLAITEGVLLELLAGAHSGEALVRLRSRLMAFPILRLEGLADFEEAARIYRVCRDAGHTLRSQIDCLIAVPALREGAAVLHNDQDFEVIARHTKLKLQRTS